MRVRRATDDDLDAVRAVHAAAIRGLAAEHYTAEQIDAWAGPRPPPVPPLRERFMLVAADDDDSVIGFGEVRGADAAGVAEIAAVYVRPDRVGRGVGGRLLRLLEEEARTRGARCLVLDASLNAVAFYAAHGFLRVADAEHTFRNGVSIPCVRMRKEL